MRIRGLLAFVNDSFYVTDFGSEAARFVLCTYIGILCLLKLTKLIP